MNNASISGYAYFPAATTYAASKAGVVAFTESLRRELKDTGVTTLHLVTPGVDTDMLDATEDAYGRYLDTSDWEKQEPEEWATKVVSAIRDDRTVLGPGGKTAIAKLASAARASWWTGSRTGCSAASRGAEGEQRLAPFRLGQQHLHVADPRARGSRPPRRPGTAPTSAGSAGRSRARRRAWRWRRTTRASGTSVSA